MFRMSRKTLTLGAALFGGLVIAFSAIPAFAQNPSQPGVGPAIAAIGITQCSTTDYADVAAKALGITAADLRVALTSGKTLQDMATSKNVPLQTVADAINKARQADLDQVVKDGLIPQRMADMMGRRQGQNSPATPPAAPQGGPQNGLQAGLGRGFFGVMMGGMGRGFGISARNVVRPYVAAAQAIGISCADLVKATRDGKSIVQVATEKNVQAQTVIDAVVKAYKDALAQDVKEGLITQAQADGQSVRLVERVTAMISNANRGRGGFLGGLFGRMFGGNGQNMTGRPGQPGQGGPDQGQPGNPPATPPATQAAQ